MISRRSQLFGTDQNKLPIKMGVSCAILFIQLTQFQTLTSAQLTNCIKALQDAPNTFYSLKSNEIMQKSHFFQPKTGTIQFSDKF